MTENINKTHPIYCINNKAAYSAAKEDIREYMNSIGVNFDVGYFLSAAAKNNQFFRLSSHIQDAQARFNEAQYASKSVSTNYSKLLNDIRGDRKIRERIIKIDQAEKQSLPDKVVKKRSAKPKHPVIEKEANLKLLSKISIPTPVPPQLADQYGEIPSFESYPKKRIKLRSERMTLICAAWFSMYYQFLDEGIYPKFPNAINYCRKPDNNPNNPVTVTLDGVFVFNKDVITEDNPANNVNFIYFLVIWCTCVFELKGQLPIADYEALDIYSRTKRSFAGILDGWKYTLMMSYDKTRYARIKNFIENCNS